MTDTALLISELRKRNVKLWIEDERLKCSAPPGALDSDIRRALTDQKDEVMACLRQATSFKTLPRALVSFNVEGGARPLYFFSGDRDNIFYIAPLARLLGADQPVLVVQPPGYDDEPALETVEELARFQLNKIQEYQPTGPYLLAGHCMGGPIAYAAAQQLTAAGHEVALLVLIASPFPSSLWPRPTKVCLLMKHLSALKARSRSERIRYVVNKVANRFRKTNAADDAFASMDAANKRVLDSSFVALRSYHPQLYTGELDLVFSSYNWFDYRKWHRVSGALRTHEFPFDVHDLRALSVVEAVSRCLKGRLEPTKAAPGPHR